MPEREGSAPTVEDGFWAAAGRADATAAANVRMLKRVMRDPPANPNDKPLAWEGGSPGHEGAAFRDRRSRTGLAASARSSPNRRRIWRPAGPRCKGARTPLSCKRVRRNFRPTGLALRLCPLTRIGKQGQVWPRAREEGSLFRPGRDAGIRGCRDPGGVPRADAALSPRR